jgi:FixJ family two-component response regulator
MARGRVIIGGMEAADRARLARFAQEAGCDAKTFTRGSEVLGALRKSERVILFLGESLEDMTAGELLANLKNNGILTTAIVIVPPMAIMAAVDAIRGGASDVQEYPLSETRFLKSLSDAQPIGKRKSH